LPVSIAIRDNGLGEGDRGPDSNRNRYGNAE